MPDSITHADAGDGEAGTTFNHDFLLIDGRLSLESFVSFPIDKR